MSFPRYVELANGVELAESSTQEFLLGTRGLTEDGRVYRYCKASTNGCERPYWGAQSRNEYNAGSSDDCYEGNTTSTQAIGGKTLVVADTNSDHGVDHFTGGYVTVFHAVNTQMYHIVGSTAGGTSVTLTLSEGLVAATDTTFVTVHPSPYSKVERVHGGGSTMAATVCVPNIAVTASCYFWGQTWGPCYCTPSGAAPGTGSYERMLSFNYEGSVSLTSAFTTGSYRQIAGWLLEETTSGDNFFMLTISP